MLAGKNCILDALESISFQGTKFFDQLVAFFEKLREPDYDLTDDKDIVSIEKEMTTLAKLIEDRLRMKLEINIEDDVGPAIDLSRLGRNNIMLEGRGDFVRSIFKDTELIKQIQKNKTGELRGTVNLKDSYVGGDFANMQLGTFYFPIKLMLNEKYTAEEVAAITLHELGHAFTFLEFYNRVSSTNQILRDLQAGLDGSQNQEQKTYVIRQYAKKTKTDMSEFRDIETKGNEQIFVILLTKHFQDITKPGNSSSYDTVMFEYLADEFASRHGAGRHIVTGLDKLYREFPHIAYRGAVSYYAWELLKFFLLTCIFATGITMLTPLLVNLYVMLVMRDGYSDLYDKPGERYRRVRRQLIQQLKEPSLPKAIAIGVRDDIAIIDNILEKVTDRVQLWGLVYDYLIPSGNRNRKTQEFERGLENLANNDLFLHAAQLRHV